MDIFIVCVALIYIRDHYFLEVLSDLHIMILTRFICLFDESMIECVFFSLFTLFLWTGNNFQYIHCRWVFFIFPFTTFFKAQHLNSLKILIPKIGTFSNFITRSVIVWGIMERWDELDFDAYIDICSPDCCSGSSCCKLPDCD